MRTFMRLIYADFFIKIIAKQYTDKSTADKKYKAELKSALMMQGAVKVYQTRKSPLSMVKAYSS